MHHIKCYLSHILSYKRIVLHIRLYLTIQTVHSCFKVSFNHWCKVALCWTIEEWSDWSFSTAHYYLLSRMCPLSLNFIALPLLNVLLKSQEISMFQYVNFDFVVVGVVGLSEEIHFVCSIFFEEGYQQMASYPSLCVL